MADIKSLTLLINELKEECSPCTRCGMCQANCPVYGQTGREADTARGKLALLDGIMEDIITDAKGVSKRLERCLLCGSCAVKCPRKIKTNVLMIKARTILTGYKGLSPLNKLIFRQVVARPKLFDRILEYSSKTQNLFIKKADDITGTSCARIISPLLSDRHFPPLAPVSFHQTTGDINTQPQKIINGQSPPKVAFFTGCLIDKLFPEVARASVNVLTHLGNHVIIPDNQGCCGIPSISSGDIHSFRKLVRYNLEKFSPENFDYIVTACATCTSTIKLIWPMIFHNDNDDITHRIRSLAEKTLDISQLVSIMGALDENTKKEINATPITYHAPCHLTKSLGISGEPLSMIGANPRYRTVEMPEPDTCCGLGGSFNLKHYNISVEIGMRKRDNIITSGAEVVATGCPACMIQMKDMLAKKGDHISVRHSIEIFEETIR